MTRTHDFWSGLIHNYSLAAGGLVIELPSQESGKYAVGDYISTERLSEPHSVFVVRSVASDRIEAEVQL